MKNENKKPPLKSVKKASISELRIQRDMAVLNGDFMLAFQLARAIDKKKGF